MPWMDRRAVGMAPLCIVAAASAGAARADSATPRALLADVYARYGSASSTGMPADIATLRGLMEPRLAAAWARNARLGATSESLDGVVDYDPFVQGQDFELTALAIGQPAIAGRCADVTVTFRNFGKPVRLGYRLVQSAGGWRILDLRGPGGTSLRRLLALRDRAAPC